MKTILLSMRVTEANNYHEKRNSIAYEYIEFFESLGYLVILIPNNTKNIDKYFDLNVEMIVLSGGNNVDPNIYGSKDLLDDVYSERDEIEKYLVDISIEQNIPIFGICRGFHFLNIYFGGSLVHNIENHVNKKHQIISDLNILSKESSNSFHNQGINKTNISSDLEVLATSDDYIESFINRDKNVFAVQWHPERQNKEYDKKLIESFLKGKI